MKCSGTFCMMPNQYCHFSSQPVPSKLNTTNWGAFCPGLSLVILNPSGSVPPAGTPPLSLAGTDVDATLDVLAGFPELLVPVAALAELEDEVLELDEPVDGADADAELLLVCGARTLLVTVIVAVLPLVQATSITEPATSRLRCAGQWSPSPRSLRLPLVNTSLLS